VHSKRRFYDLFASFYDRFVRFHSGDRQESMREFLASVADARAGHTVVDLCAGTGSSTMRLARSGARVIGVDFSAGMLRQARKKSGTRPGIHWIQADVCGLPISSGSVDRATCSYAMYELTGMARRDVLQEVARVLKPEGKFVMMEHLPPQTAFLRLLYFVRIHVLGSKGVRSFVGSEETELGRFLVRVGTVMSDGGKTKAVFGYKPVPGGNQPTDPRRIPGPVT
jgi:ubiquinone/menaquinone biosynthesis C-methylase UbiE